MNTDARGADGGDGLALWAPLDLQPAIARCVADLAAALSSRRFYMATAESCTGGGIAYSITSRPGSSDWFAGGAVTYTNALKMQMLGVKAETLAQCGAVSEAVAAEMAAGAAQRLGCQLAVAVSGIAGPGGGTQAKPVGMVCFAWHLLVPQAGMSGGSVASISKTETVLFAGGRESVRMQTILHALQGCLREIHRLQ